MPSHCLHAWGPSPAAGGYRGRIPALGQPPGGAGGTLAPIWLPHCPAWMCTISRMVPVPVPPPPRRSLPPSAVASLPPGLRRPRPAPAFKAPAEAPPPGVTSGGLQGRGLSRAANGSAGGGAKGGGRGFASPGRAGAGAGGCRARARLLPALPHGRRRGNGLKLEYRKLHFNIRNMVFGVKHCYRDVML